MDLKQFRETEKTTSQHSWFCERYKSNVVLLTLQPFTFRRKKTKKAIQYNQQNQLMLYTQKLTHILPPNSQGVNTKIQ